MQKKKIKKGTKKIIKTGRKSQCQCLSQCKSKSLPGEAFCKEHLRACPAQSYESGWEPNYDPKFWNKKFQLQDTHNCFSYAMNVNDPKQLVDCRTVRDCNVPFHQPGSASGTVGFNSNKPKTCPNMVKRILGDNPNVQMSKFEEKCPPKTSQIALVVDASDDYHFLRKDKGGYWSQKSGARPVTNLDAGGHKIWNPQLCDLDYTKNGSDLNYDIFCGFMCVPREQPLYLRVGGGKTRKRSSRA